MKRFLVGLCLFFFLGTSWTVGAFDETQLQKLQLLGESCPSCDLSWAKFSKEDLSGRNLTEADLTQAYLNGANLSGANLTNAKLTSANLCTANLRKANLHNLVPAIGQVNAHRNNYSFAIFSEGSDCKKGAHNYGACEIKISSECDLVEPPTHTRGAIARIYLYMLDKYKFGLDIEQQNLFRKWMSYIL